MTDREQQDVKTFRTLFANYLTDQAEWREEKAAEHPNDERNAGSARGLSALADYVASLPLDTFRLVRLAGLCPSIADALLFGEHAAGVIARYHFDDPTEDGALFLDRLADEMESDREAGAEAAAR